MKPKSHSEKEKGELIRFAIGECFLGAVLVASSEKGICALSLGDHPEELVVELRERFAEAELVGGDKDYVPVLSQVIDLLETSGDIAAALPLDVRGTDFQVRVWEALQEIPAGRTVTYTELAAQIGSPKAARAVASACAANQIAVAIPCHRVVRKGGVLSGYRWGIDRKRRLIEREAGLASSA